VIRKIVLVVQLLAILVSIVLFGCQRNHPQHVNVVEQPDTLVSPDGKGRLEGTGFGRIVKLQGTASEVGYNYGYLLAPQIMEMLNQYVLWTMQSKGMNFLNLQFRVLKDVRWDAPFEEELSAMVQGMLARLPKSERMVGTASTDQHEVGVADLKILNTLPDWVKLGCSSFAVWDSATVKGATLLARNLDWSCDPNEIIKASHVVVSYDIPGRKKWVSIGFCGYIGCLTGMNEDGACFMMQDANGFPVTDTTGLVPRGLVLRQLIESIGATDSATQIDRILDSLPTLAGNNIMICFAAKNRSTENVGMVAEYDGCKTRPDGYATIRSVLDNPTLGVIDTFDYSIPYKFMIIDVNHFLKRNHVPAGGFSSDERYNNMRLWLNKAYNEGIKVDLTLAQQIMKGVGRPTLTLQTILFEPDLLTMRIYFAESGIPSYLSQGFDYTFAELF
jgi:hypothetical protein